MQVVKVNTQAPFPRLKSQLCISLILSFVGSLDEIRPLLARLSKKTADFLEEHISQIRAFIIDKRRTPFFGPQKLAFAEERCRYFSWPESINLEKFASKRICVSKIQLRVGLLNRFLTGVRVILSDGTISPWQSGTYSDGER